MPSPDFQLTPSGLKGMGGGKAEREEGAKRGETEETHTQGLGFDRFSVLSSGGS